MPKSTCSIAHCDREVLFKFYALCKRCYQRKRRAGEIDGLRSGRTCVWCDGEIVGRTARAIYCSESCRESRKRANATQGMRRESAARKIGRECRVCGTDISHRRLGAVYCGRFCSERMRGLHALGPVFERTCALEGCEVVFMGFQDRKKCCSEAHAGALWNRESRADGRQQNDPWSERRRAAYHRRRAIKKGATIGDPFTNVEIFERDRWTCQLCDVAVDAGRVWPDPLSPSLDHIVPLSLGGHHSRENTSLAHLRCNVRKGNRAAGEQLRLLG